MKTTNNRIIKSFSILCSVFGVFILYLGISQSWEVMVTSRRPLPFSMRLWPYLCQLGIFTIFASYQNIKKLTHRSLRKLILIFSFNLVLAIQNGSLDEGFALLFGTLWFLIYWITGKILNKYLEPANKREDIKN